MKRILTLLLFIVGASACTQAVNFSPTHAVNNSSQSGSGGGGGGGGGGPTCNQNLGQTTVLTKMLFIMDMSGSNQSGPGCTISALCTDPGKAMRAGSIAKFFADYGSKTNFQWGFEIFQGTTATALVGPSGSGDFSSASAMQSAITTFQNMTDQDNTPYMAALTMAQGMIANDPDLNGPQKPQYLIVFMSDGQPDGATDTPQTILSEIGSIMALSPRITFSAVYYGEGDAVAAGLLQSMSQAGNGHFLNTNLNPTGLDFQISDLINIPCP